MKPKPTEMDNTNISLPQDSENNRLNCGVGIDSQAQSLKRVDNDCKEGLKDSPEGIIEMEDHYMQMINPESLCTVAKLEDEYKREQINKAEQFLVADGFKLIERGEIPPSLFR